MPKAVWNHDYYIKAYDLAKQGMRNQRLAKALGISKPTLLEWMKRHPAFKRAIQTGREQFNKVQEGSFREYVYEQLSPEMKEVWDEINACSEDPNGVVRIEALLHAKGKRVRQHMFLYAVVDNNFNASQACRFVNISVHTLRLWIANDPDFRELMDEINWHKKNFYEEGLVALVRRRDPAATIYANKTYNRDRGYGDSKTVEHTGKLEHDHSGEVRVIDNEKLQKLPLQTRRQLLELMDEDVEDAEFEEVQ